MAYLGTHIPLTCPACAERVVLPVKETGREGSTVTVSMDLTPFHTHIAAAHTRKDHRPGEAAVDPDVPEHAYAAPTP
ncbi:hypothetical protein ACFZB5_13520 [Streptomyces nodosus]|uniref:hypothetical protein n=1 Tax=Streptomyces nodosus TaxID=40318 RepID=UPI0036E13887